MYLYDLFVLNTMTSKTIILLLLVLGYNSSVEKIPYGQNPPDKIPRCLKSPENK